MLEFEQHISRTNLLAQSSQDWFLKRLAISKFYVDYFTDYQTYYQVNAGGGTWKDCATFVASIASMWTGPVGAVIGLFSMGLSAGECEHYIEDKYNVHL